MDDVWLYVDENDDSSHSFDYSDKVDSETETELYGMIHHQEKLYNEAPYKKDPDSDKSLEISNSINSKIRGTSCKESNNNESNCSISSLRLLPKSLNNSYINKTALHKSSFKKNVHNFSTALKRKSDSERKYSSKLLPEFISPTKKACKNSPIKDILKQKNTTVLDSSDSDESFIWTEKDIVNNDLQTNLSHDVDTITISSDSDVSVSDSMQLSRKEMVMENAFLFSTNKDIAKNSENNLVLASNSDSQSTKLSQLKTEEIIKKNASLSSVRIKGNSKELWYIDDEDRYRSKHSNYRPRRYHMPKERTCINCGAKGHLAKYCAVPKKMKCYICGGAHAVFQCPNRMCGKCYHMGHDSRFCWMKVFSFCDHCNMKGHMKKNCPDLWRRYHLTTEPVTIVAGKLLKQNKDLYCFNCGCAGHFGAVCQEPRNPFITWPCVVSYNNPKEKRKVHQRNTDFKDVHYNQNNTNFVNVHPNQRNILKYSHQTEDPDLNTVQNFSSKKKNVTKKLKKSQKLKLKALACKQIKLALREKDFPRPPKRADIEKYIDGMPEGAKLVLNNQLKKMRNQGRKKVDHQ